DNKRALDFLAMNPHTNVEMVESSWNHFKTPKRVKSLVEHTSDPELVMFLLDRSERRGAVLQTALHNWFLPEDLYVDAMGKVSGAYAASIIGYADGYSKQAKTLVAKNLEVQHAEKWIAWDDTGFTDNELLDLIKQLSRVGIYSVGWGTGMFEAVLCRRPHLIPQLEQPYKQAVAEVLAGMRITDDIVTNILDVAETSSGLYWTALLSLYHNPWISLESHEAVTAALNSVRYNRFSPTDRVCWSKLGDTPEMLDNYWEEIRDLGPLSRKVLTAVLEDPVLMSKPHTQQWVTKMFLYNQVLVHELRWLDRDTATMLHGLIKPNLGWTAATSPVQWDYTSIYKDTRVWIWDFDCEIHSDIPIRRTPPPKISGTSNKDVNWAEHTWYKNMLDTDPLVLASWFLNQLGDATTPHSVALWEILFSLWPKWEHTYGELVTATKKIGGRV
ncbi:MAG: hypothetical protein WDA77_13630, partial [Acidimicrobiia bacterium]